MKRSFLRFWSIRLNFNLSISKAVNPGQFKQDVPNDDLSVHNQPASISASPSTRASISAPVVPNVKSPEEQLRASQIKTEIPSIASPEVSLLSDQSHSIKLQQLSENIARNNLSHFGNFGINTSNPDEALTVVGNVKVLGNILQPSDYRVKENFKPVNFDSLFFAF